MLLSIPVLVCTLCLWALQESFWRFKIPEHKLDVPVLVVGHVSEPRVAFDRPSLSFGKVLIGGKTHATINLFNSEHMPFQFNLDKASYDASPARLESTGILWHSYSNMPKVLPSAAIHWKIQYQMVSTRQSRLVERPLIACFADACSVRDMHDRCRQSFSCVLRSIVRKLFKMVQPMATSWYSALGLVQLSVRLAEVLTALMSSPTSTNNTPSNFSHESFQASCKT